MTLAAFYDVIDRSAVESLAWLTQQCRLSELMFWCYQFCKGFIFSRWMHCQIQLAVIQPWDKRSVLFLSTLNQTLNFKTCLPLATRKIARLAVVNFPVYVSLSENRCYSARKRIRRKRGN